MVDYLVRFGLSVAIVSMVVDTGTANVSTPTNLPLPDGACPAALNNTHDDNGISVSMNARYRISAIFYTLLEIYGRVFKKYY